MQQPPAYTQPGSGQVVYTTNPQPAQPTYLVQNSGQTRPYEEGCCSGLSEKFNAQGGLITGVVQLIIAVLSVILGGVSYAFPIYWYVGYSIWAGLLFFLPAGILGIFTKTRRTGVIVSYLIVSILCSLQAVGMLAYEAIAAGASTSLTAACDYYFYYDYCRSDGSIAVHAILAILAFVELVVSIVGAALCCGGLRCCCAGQVTSTTTTVYYNGQAQPQPNQVVVQSAMNGQQVAYPQGKY
ncbi:uncharacterized protein [Diadema antillarum]|uniref:uncharacterized protein n=1 Tax=Diadema antillarum TaxID=105358 RepID=UPI003A85B0A3